MVAKKKCSADCAGKPALRRMEFSINAGIGKKVSVAGSFNDWDPAMAPMEYDSASKTYRITIELCPGEYEYKFVVDGEWLLDEANPGFYPNDFGTLNSTLEVK